MKSLKLLMLASITMLCFNVGHTAPPTINVQEKAVLKPLPTPEIVQTIYMNQVGVREATGHNDGKSVEVYLRSVGLGKGYAWCAAFVKWTYDKAGVKNTMTGAAASAHNPKNLLYFKHKLLREPDRGDAFTLYYAKLGRIGHTGFYNKRLNNSIYQSVEGNTNAEGSREGDGVYVKYRSFNATYSISRWITLTVVPNTVSINSFKYSMAA